MKTLNLILAVLTIIGAINWGLVGIAQFNIVGALAGENTPLARLIYDLIGISGIYYLRYLIFPNRAIFFVEK